MLRKTLQATVFVIHSAVGYAEPSTSLSPRYFFEPIKTQVVQCSQLGVEWRSRLVTTLRSAQSNTANILPAESWDHLLLATTKLESGVPLNAQVDTCKKFVSYLSDSILSNHIRGGVVTGLYLHGVTGCAAEFPSLANALRAAWLEAFKRNELIPDGQLYDEYIRTNWRKPSGDKRQKNECDKTIKFLKDPVFDETASEQGVKKFFRLTE
jgi:hypothetical protein